MKTSIVLNLPCVPLFKDEMVLVASKNHPTIKGPLLKHDVYNEQHAAVSLDRFASFSQPWYDTVDKQASIAYQGMAMMSYLAWCRKRIWSLLRRVGWLKSSLNP